MAEELTRSLETLADRGVPRGAVATLEAGRAAALRRLEPWWVRRPALVAVVACASTLTLLGGTLAAGMAYRQPQHDVGSGWTQLNAPNRSVDPLATWWLIGAVVLAVMFVALILRTHLIRARKEPEMATIVESPTRTADDRIERVERRDRRLLWTVLVLAIALVALGAYVVFDTASTPDTAANAEVTQLYDDYNNSWVDVESGRFRELVGASYTFGSQGRVSTADEQESTFAIFGGFESVETIGGPIVTTNGSEYYVAAVQRITDGGIEYVGASVMRMADHGDGLKVTEHRWIGNL